MLNHNSEVTAEPTGIYFFPSNYDPRRNPEISHFMLERDGGQANEDERAASIRNTQVDSAAETNGKPGSDDWTFLRDDDYDLPQRVELVGEDALQRHHQAGTNFRGSRKFLIYSLLLIVLVSSVLVAIGIEHTKSAAEVGGPTTATTTKKPFTSKQELYRAVDKWLANKKTTELAAIYGYPIGEWDVSRVTDFSYLFDACDGCDLPARNLAAARFNDDISYWNVSSAKNMSHMFRAAANFSGDLSRWDVSHVTDMSWMFSRATSFNSDLSGWDVSSVVDMRAMFTQASSFDADLSSWDVSQVKHASFMFVRATIFNSNLANWNLSIASDINMMFYGASAYNHDLCSWGSHVKADTYIDVAFGASGCPDQNDPDLNASPPGPFCHACM